MSTFIRSLTVLGVIALGVVGLAACSSSAKATSSTSSATASGSPAADNRGRGDSALREFLSTDAAKTCLSAAGIAVPSFGAFPSGARPSGARRSGAFPSGERPSGAFPSGARPSGGFGGAFGQQFTKIEAALKACGLTVPTRAPGAPGGSAAPTTAAPSS
ncbi:hypothetical protein SAMN05444157_2178 [Frankineae bacterium MT45]|nr:hypothetical protein SAMN05444157_2178 [Frankineae bacterium MT45]